MKVIASGLQFPEGPISMPDGSVLLVEIARQTLTRVRPDGRTEIVAQVPGGPNGAAMGPGGKVFICNNGGFNWVREGQTFRPHGQADSYDGGRIEVVDTANGRVERLYDRCGEHALKGPNDLVFDGQGGFWFTDHGKRRDRDMDRGYVFWAREDGSEIREVIGGLFAPNGIGLSPDGRTLYVAETDSGRLWCWDVTGPGTVAKAPWPSPNGGRLVVGVGGYRRFDSLAISASGQICIAALDTCSVMEISPDGSRVVPHTVPDMLVTNICFGGQDLRTAYVTMSHEGRLCEMAWHEPGLALAYG
ncbi:SMP-30/gluconolactonase/LRE family protein [Pseudoroseomonas wenyumeiae]|uniref:SMP-30/gluconolactonase/LRE family protein n=1 Tax=Teichococcus wenyumeiae TaxID=2478470 RepID=A0A3A9J8F4_9PROT|nr:SMP-30/gluconolactonase/LRE family protein [Pseudoroseomonas wenyumeiae]RKK02762.1 SMP-30/gluconolactonase/LRE family protein [Pseudoroseomonas wenyumeiae]RMI19859.1 SMP-30/gluconolactonase/LRE family protein [Pseudoroseomonas wenyumeiae]